jgi:hypothetical protein
MPLALILIFSGVIAGYMGLNNVSLKGILTDQPSPITNPTGGSSTTSATTSTGTAPITGINTPNVMGSVTRAQLDAIGTKKGWNAAQISDWFAVIQRESGGNPTDQNSRSSAYGIAQFINGPSEYYTYGGTPNTVEGQLDAMANYISERYGTPSAALAHEYSNDWY